MEKVFMTYVAITMGIFIFFIVTMLVELFVSEMYSNAIKKTGDSSNQMRLFILHTKLSKLFKSSIYTLCAWILLFPFVITVLWIYDLWFG